jgi:tetratricopeptide (TPR) repeat protein
LPDDITGRELHRSVMQQLRSLPDRLALRVARHLVAAGRLLDSDPETAYRHALAARARAARLAVVREACGEAAYLAGHYAEALTELRAARRMNGSSEYLPVMADCERALGRPERALALSKDDVVRTLDQATRVEMLIVASGARLDLGQADLAIAVLEGRDLRSASHAPWAARLRYAYADALLAAGRTTDALEWFHRAAAVDSTSVTDAADRILELEGLAIIDTEAEDEEEDESGSDPQNGTAETR